LAGFTSEQLQKLEEAIAQGALRVKYSDKEVQYRSLDEMMRIRDMMRKALNVNSDQYPNRIYPTVSKGLG
jgi:hypothetical protein